MILRGAFICYLKSCMFAVLNFLDLLSEISKLSFVTDCYKIIENSFVDSYIVWVYNIL